MGAAFLVLVAALSACLTPPPVEHDAADASTPNAMDPLDVSLHEDAATTPDARGDSGPRGDSVVPTDVAPPRDVGQDGMEGTRLGRDASPDWITPTSMADAPIAPPVDHSPLSITWDQTTSHLPSGNTPAAVAPDGTLYVAREDASGTTRLVRGRPVDRTLVSAFGVDARVRFRIAAPEGVAVMPDGLAVDARGVYLLVRLDRPLTLFGVRFEAASCALIALDPRGGLRWARPLGPAAWADDTRLFGRRDDRLVVVGAATGQVSLGALRLEAETPRLVVAEVSRDGAGLALRDLGDMAGEFARVLSADMNVRGDLVAVLADPHERSAWDGYQLRRWGADGEMRWSQLAPYVEAALDDDGNVYVASQNLCSAFSNPPTQSNCVVSLDAAGALRWAARRSLPDDPYSSLSYGGSLVWRQGRLLYTSLWLQRSLWSGISGPSSTSCLSARFVGDVLSLDAHGVGGAASGGDGLTQDVLEGGGRRCVVSVLWSVPSRCGGPSPDRATGRVRCDGDARGCAEGRARCGDACVDLQADAAHCGACGRSCEGAFPHASGVCVAGACRYGICDRGRASCNGAPEDGCEVDVASDPMHCGGCDVRCAAGERCEGGRCCAGGRCGPGPFPSNGVSGAFAPHADVTLDGVIRQVTTALVPAGVTVRSADNVLRLYAQGEVRIDGTIELSGRPGRIGCGTDDVSAACSPAAPGAAPGRGGSIGAYGYCGRCERVPGVVYDLHPAYGSGSAVSECGGSCGGHNDTPPGTYNSGQYALNGTIGVAATEDLAVYSVFEPGSRGGTTFRSASTAPGGVRESTFDYGGGGGGAVRIASATRIVLGPRARILVNGRDGGSGGVVVLHAPEVRVAVGAEVSALGGATSTGEPSSLGRVRVSVDAARCTLDGTFRPPLAAGCQPTPAAHAPARTHVTPWPL